MYWFLRGSLVAKGGVSIERKIADLSPWPAIRRFAREHAMSLGEMEALLKQMDEFRHKLLPHGRNVYVEIAKTKIERDFGRSCERGYSL